MLWRIISTRGTCVWYCGGVVGRAMNECKSVKNVVL